MPRNVERDLQEEKKRRARLISVGFRLFSENGIENVNLQTVADEAEVGVATLYNYYGNKVNLVAAISADMWQKVWDELKERKGVSDLYGYTAYEVVELYLNEIIRLYRERPDILRFSGNFKTFVNRELAGLSDENDDRIKEHMDTVNQFSKIFQVVYDKAKIDKSIRTDYSEEEIFTMISLTMLGTAERYAQGIIWARNKNNIYTVELNMLKDMILKWIKEL